MILTPDQRLRVFISSTLLELADERAAAKEAVTSLRMTPVLFELGARPHPARDLYRAYLEQSHIFIGIYWQRYGWIAPDMSISGLEDEFRLSAGKPRLLYIKDPAPDREARLTALVNEIESESGASYKLFSTPEQLRNAIQDDLAVMLTERFQMMQAASAGGAGPVEQRILNLPSPATPLIGRQAELAEISRLISRPEVRIVTLHGPGGIGKTRLVIEVAHRLVDQFQHGVCYVPLASISDPQLVPLTIAQSLGLQESKAEEIDAALSDFLARRQLLLVLDNLEQVIQAAGDLSGLIARSPLIKILATSRSVLHLSGEYQYPVTGLDLPPPEERGSIQAEDLATLAGYPAIALFLQSAQRLKPDFEFDVENARDIIELCCSLDGLPLAIELAAARIKLLSPQAMRSRLEKSLQWLTAGARDLPARQQTLRGAIEWSYGLLGEDEKKLLNRLGVFLGSFTLEAVEAVCNSDGSLDAIDLIARLIDNSLVLQAPESGDEARFGMLGTIREYALENLNTSRERDEIHRLHAVYYQRLTETSAAELRGLRQQVELDRLDLGYDNIRAAVQWSLMMGEVDRAACIGWNLWYFWWNRGHHIEARSWMEAVVQQLEILPADLRGRAVYALGVIYTMQGDARRAFDYIEIMNQDLHQAGNQGDEAMGLTGSGIVLMYLNDAENAGQYFRRSLSLFRELKDKWGIAFALACTGQMEISQQNFMAATSLLAESAAIFWETGDKNGIIFAQYELAMALLMQGDPEWASSLLQNGLSLAYSLKQKQNIANCLEGLACVAAMRGDMERSARLWGAADAIREVSQNPTTPNMLAMYTPFLQKARAELGELAYLESWQAGRALSIPKTVAFAASS